jgi:predicted molibdopterin-dependent oxidoreductase YjgC
VSWERIEEKGFLQWPCPTPDHPGTEIVHRDGNFLRGKARLTPAGWAPPGESPDPDYPFILVTGRQLLHYNAGTMTRRTDIVQLQRAPTTGCRSIRRTPNRLGIQDDQPIRIASRRGEVEAKAQVTDAVRPGNLFMTFHFPETRTNSLIGDFSDSYTQCPEYKVCAVKVSPARNL